jgi:hypothetical protein
MSLLAGRHHESSRGSPALKEFAKTRSPDCQEPAGEAIPLQVIIRVRERRRRELRRAIEDRRKAVDSLLESRRGVANVEQSGEVSAWSAKPGLSVTCGQIPMLNRDDLIETTPVSNDRPEIGDCVTSETRHHRRRESVTYPVTISKSRKPWAWLVS